MNVRKWAIKENNFQMKKIFSFIQTKLPFINNLHFPFKNWIEKKFVFFLQLCLVGWGFELIYKNRLKHLIKIKMIHWIVKRNNFFFIFLATFINRCVKIKMLKYLILEKWKEKKSINKTLVKKTSSNVLRLTIIILFLLKCL